MSIESDVAKKLNGKKSYIGFLGYCATQFAMSQSWIDFNTARPLLIFFEGLIGVGIVHKLAKLEKKES